MAGELIHRNKEDVEKQHLTLVAAMQRIDMPSLVFFIGILLAVATLEHTHILTSLAQWLDKVVGGHFSGRTRPGFAALPGREAGKRPLAAVLSRPFFVFRRSRTVNPVVAETHWIGSGTIA